MKRLALYILLTLFSVSFFQVSAQRGKIIKKAVNTTVMDPNNDGYVSKTTAGFSNDGYYVDEFEIPMFGIPKLGGDVVGDNIGQQCGITDLIPDRDGFSVYAFRDASNNLIFRFRVGRDNPSVEAYTVLLDIDNKFGANDPNATAFNPGFEIDITLIKRANAGVRVYNIDGSENCPNNYKQYPYNKYFQIAIADEVSCNDPDFFYDFYVPFDEIAQDFGIDVNTGLRYVAVTNVSATCAMNGRISDISGLDFTDYRNNVPEAFIALVENQCPTPVVDLSEGGPGFERDKVSAPIIFGPLRAGQNQIAGATIEPNIYIKVEVYTNIGTAQSPNWSNNPADARETKAVYATGTSWTVLLDNPLLAYDKVVARAQKDEFSVPCGGAGGNESSTTSITVVQLNNKPVLNGNNNNAPLIYTENDGAVPVQPLLLVNDIDDTIYDEDNYDFVEMMYGAEIAIIANYLQNQDVLSFTPQFGVSGSFNPATGVLTLTGTATIAQYQTVLRSVNYTNTSEDPSSLTRTVQFIVRDQFDPSDPYTRNVVVVPVNDPPIISGTTSPLTYPEASIVIDPSIIITDVDNTQMMGATVWISTNFQSAKDVLLFSNQNGITGSYNGATGILTLTGASSIANYMTALSSVRYENNSLSTTEATRLVNFKVNDGIDDSNTHSRNIVFDFINSPPVIVDDDVNNNPISQLEFTINEDEILQVCITATDADGDEVILESYRSFTNNGSVTFNGGLCFTFTPNQDFFGEEQFELVVTDQRAVPGRDTVLVIVTVLPVNDAPIITGTTSPLTYAGSTVAIDPTINITDVDDVNMESAVVWISTNYQAGEDALLFSDQNNITGVYNAGTGTWTLTGTSSIANYITALRSIQYQNTSGTPNQISRQISFRVNDGGLNSNTHTRSIIFTLINNPPVVVDENGDPVVGDIVRYEIDEDEVLDECLLAIDPDGDVVVIETFGPIPGFPLNGVFEVTGGLCFRFTPEQNFTGETRLSVTVTDQRTENTGRKTVTVIITVNAVNDAPVVTGTASQLTYPYTTVVIDPSVLVSDIDSDNMQFAEVWIGNVDVPEDNLAHGSLPAGITSSFNAGTKRWELSGTASKSAYTNALRSFTYFNNNSTPLTTTRQVNFRVKDDGGLNSNTFTRSIIFVPLNNPPDIVDENDNPIDTLFITINEDEILNRCILAKDADGDQVVLESFQSFTNRGLIELLGGLCLRFTPELNYYGLEIFRLVVSDQRSTPGRDTVIVKITINPVNDAPEISGTAGTLMYPGSAVSVDNAIDVTDVDDTNMESAVVSISQNFRQGEDILLFTNQNGITGNYNGATGILNLAGSATITAYESALSSVRYQNNADEPTLLLRSVSFVVNDGELNSNTHSRLIDFSANRAPVVIGPDTLYLTTPEDSTLHYCFSAFDPDGDDVRLTSVTNVSGGGTTEPDDIEFCFLFTPVPDYNGESRWLIQVCDDGFPELCKTVLVIIDITPVNDPPVAFDDNITAISGVQTEPINLLDNDTDIDGDDLILTNTPLTGPFKGLVFMDTNGTFRYISNTGYLGRDSIQYRVCDTGVPSLCDTAFVLIEVGPAPFKIYEGLSPNGDGLNDYWRIDGIEQFRNNLVRVFDRYNNLVFEMKSYSNEDSNKRWSGQSNHGMAKGSLPEGTYYYVVDQGNGTGLFSGYVILKRQ